MIREAREAAGVVILTGVCAWAMAGVVVAMVVAGWPREFEERERRRRRGWMDGW